MKSIEIIGKEARKRFEEMKKELPLVHTEDSWAYFYMGWLEVSYMNLFEELKNIKQKLEQYESNK